MDLLTDQYALLAESQVYCRMELTKYSDIHFLFRKNTLRSYDSPLALFYKAFV